MISGFDWMGAGLEVGVSEKVKDRRLHSATRQPPFSKTSSGKVDCLMERERKYGSLMTFIPISTIIYSSFSDLKMQTIFSVQKSSTLKSSRTIKDFHEMVFNTGIPKCSVSQNCLP